MKGVAEGIVTVRYRKPLSNPAACHIDRGQVVKEVALGAVENVLKQEVPEVKRVILVEST